MTTTDKMTDTIIIHQLLDDDQRLSISAEIFGYDFVKLEMTVYAITDNLSPEYNGGFWKFFSLSNGGFYMSPDFDGNFSVTCENGFSGSVSGDALGVIACLYAYSHLSFSGNEGIAEVYSRQYHLLREFIFQHPEVESILRAID